MDILNWLWTLGVQSFYGGSTAVHLGPGPAVDDVHLRSLRAALLDGGELELTEQRESEDVGRRWEDPRALAEYGDRRPTAPWAWAGPERRVEERPPAGWVGRWLRGLGERGILAAAAGVIVARPPVSDFEFHPSESEAQALRDAQRDVVIDTVARYNPDAVVCVGVPFGHTRPQWIVPYGGRIILDGARLTVTADYSSTAAASPRSSS